MMEFVREADPRRTSHRTRSAWVVYQMLENTKLLSGSYREALIRDVIQGSPLGFGPFPSADALRRWRLRETKRWSGYKPPRWPTDDAYPRLVGKPRA